MRRFAHWRIQCIPATGGHSNCMVYNAIPLYIAMNNKTIGIAIGACILLFVPFLGSVHLFDWDEINFAECAREMVTSGNYSTVTIDYLPFWE